MKVHAPHMIEGPEAFTRFENAMRAAVAVPHSERELRNTARLLTRIPIDVGQRGKLGLPLPAPLALN